MPHRTTRCQKLKRLNGTRLTLQEFRRRLAEGSPEIVSFRETDSYGKKTNRLRLPKSFFKSFHGLSQLVRVTLGLEGQLVLVPYEVWYEYLDETRATLAKFGCEHFVEEFIRNSEPVRIDAKHRIGFSARSVARAGLKDEVLVCAGRTIEVWDEKVHDHYREQFLLTVNAKVGIPTNSQRCALPA